MFSPIPFILEAGHAIIDTNTNVVFSNLENEADY